MGSFRFVQSFLISESVVPVWEVWVWWDWWLFGEVLGVFGLSWSGLLLVEFDWFMVAFWFFGFGLCSCFPFLSCLRFDRFFCFGLSFLMTVSFTTFPDLSLFPKKNNKIRLEIFKIPVILLVLDNSSNLVSVYWWLDFLYKFLKRKFVN